MILLHDLKSHYYEQDNLWLAQLNARDCTEHCSCQALHTVFHQEDSALSEMVCNLMAKILSAQVKCKFIPT